MGFREVPVAHFADQKENLRRSVVSPIRWCIVRVPRRRARDLEGESLRQIRPSSRLLNNLIKPFVWVPESLIPATDWRAFERFLTGCCFGGWGNREGYATV